ncbi:MAG: hypothetical protein ACP5T0_08145 [Verrucomicrobiia bacterium]
MRDVNLNPNQIELERWAKAQLDKLPKIKAPQTLSKKVMLRIAKENQSAQWKRPFNEWNIIYRVTFALFSTALAIALIWIMEYAGNYYRIMPREIINPDSPNLIFVLYSFVSTIVATLEILIEQYQTQLLILLLIAGVIYGLCVGLATFCFHLSTVNKKQTNLYIIE